MAPSKTALSREEKRVFDTISYAIGDRRAHPIEDIKGVAVPKHLISVYMAILVKKGYYDFDGKNYTLAGAGKIIFKQRRDTDFRNTGPKIRAY
jgi:intein/homing endonuclease